MSDFSLSYEGLTLTPENGYIVTLAQGLDGLPVRSSKSTLPNTDGGNIWATLYEMRLIDINVTIKGTSVADFFEKRRALNQAFTRNEGGTLSITMWDGTTRQITAHVMRGPQIMNVPGEVTFTKARIELECPDPFFESTTTDSYSTGLPVEGGFAIPFAIPLSISGSTGGNFVIANDGDVSRYASFTITGSVNTPSVRNATTGKQFRIDRTLSDADIVTVYKNQEGLFVLLNGSTNIRDDFVGDFFKIQAGNNTINFNASVYDADALLEAEFTNAYLST